MNAEVEAHKICSNPFLLRWPLEVLVSTTMHMENNAAGRLLHIVQPDMPTDITTLDSPLSLSVSASRSLYIVQPGIFENITTAYKPNCVKFGVLQEGEGVGGE